MARKQTPGLQDWGEVDAALQRIGEIDREVTIAETRMNRKIDDLKDEYKAKAEPLHDEKKALERDLKRFCDAHRADFGERQSRQLTFGVVSYRRVAKLVIHSVRNTIAAIRAQLGAAAEKYIRVKEDLNKEALEQLPEETLAALGCSISAGETFGYEVKAETLAAVAK